MSKKPNILVLNMTIVHCDSPFYQNTVSCNTRVKQRVRIFVQKFILFFSISNKC